MLLIGLSGEEPTWVEKAARHEYQIALICAHPPSLSFVIQLGKHLLNESPTTKAPLGVGLRNVEAWFQGVVNHSVLWGLLLP